MEPHPKKKAKLKESSDSSRQDAKADTAAAEDSAAVEPAAALSQGTDAALSAEESLLIRRRAMNTIHSRRKRERQRIEIEVLKEQCAEYNAKNSKLRNDNAQMELLLRSLQPHLPAMDAPVFLPPAAASLPTNAPPTLTHPQLSQPSTAASFLTSPNDAHLQSFWPSQPWPAAPPSFLPPSSQMYAANRAAATGDLGRRAASEPAPGYAPAPTQWPNVNDVWVQQLAALAMAQLRQQQQLQQQQLQQQQWQQLQQQLQQPTTQQLLASLPPSLNIQLLQQLLQTQTNTTDSRPNDNDDDDAPPPPPV